MPARNQQCYLFQHRNQRILALNLVRVHIVQHCDVLQQLFLLVCAHQLSLALQQQCFVQARVLLLSEVHFLNQVRYRAGLSSVAMITDGLTVFCWRCIHAVVAAHLPSNETCSHQPAWLGAHTPPTSSLPTQPVQTRHTSLKLPRYMRTGVLIIAS